MKTKDGGSYLLAALCCDYILAKPFSSSTPAWRVNAVLKLVEGGSQRKAMTTFSGGELSAGFSKSLALV